MAGPAGSGLRPSAPASTLAPGGATHTHLRYDQNLKSVPSAIPMTSAML